MFLHPEQKEFKNLNQIFQDIQNIYFLHIHTGQYIVLTFRGEEGVAAIIISWPPSALLSLQAYDIFPGEFISYPSPEI